MSWIQIFRWKLFLFLIEILIHKPPPPIKATRKVSGENLCGLCAMRAKILMYYFIIVLAHKVWLFVFGNHKVWLYPNKISWSCILNFLRLSPTLGLKRKIFNPKKFKF